MEDTVEGNGEGAEKEAREEEGLCDATQRSARTVVLLPKQGMAHLDNVLARLEHLDPTSESLALASPDCLDDGDHKSRNELNKGMDDPASDEIEGNPVAPGLNVFADVVEMFICIRAILDGELDDQGRGDNQKDKNRIAKKGGE